MTLWKMKTAKITGTMIKIAPKSNLGKVKFGI